VAFCKQLHFAELDYIPLSALEGDMIVERGDNLDWYDGKSLLEFLETSPATERKRGDFRFPVQLVGRAKMGRDGDHRGYLGRIESGHVTVGDSVKVLPSGIEAKIADIVLLNDSLRTASAPQSVTVVLDRQIDISRGDMIVHTGKEPRVANQISANLSWLSTQPLDINRKYLIKHTTQQARAIFEGIDYRLNVNTLERETDVTTFKLNDIGRVRLRTLRPLMVDAYAVARETGSFILIDEVSNETVAGGMIVDVTDTGEKL
jgi:sulfate adenylyltransferase subunit 1